MWVAWEALIIYWKSCFSWRLRRQVCHSAAESTAEGRSKPGFDASHSYWPWQAVCSDLHRFSDLHFSSETLELLPGGPCSQCILLLHKKPLTQAGAEFCRVLQEFLVIFSFHQLRWPTKRLQAGEAWPCQRSVEVALRTLVDPMK